jgi:meso-butanediol dehydrogenase/(S,S)-butanediol dehydrogenase/diacetyl reductase
MSLETKIAIVTGAARGIGKATAMLLAEGGINVVVSDILSLEKTVDDIKSTGVDVFDVKCDVSNSKDWYIWEDRYSYKCCRSNNCMPGTSVG